MPPKAWGPREWRGEMIYENAFERSTIVRILVRKNIIDIFDTSTCSMGTTIHNKVHKKWDLRYGHNHPAVGINKQTQVWSQPSNQKIHITSHSNQQRTRSLDFIKQNPGSCTPSRPEKSTNWRMWICELKSNMKKHRLGTNQWLKLFIDVRETTNNDNDSQCMKGTIHGMWIVIWCWTPTESVVSFYPTLVSNWCSKLAMEYHTKGF